MYQPRINEHGNPCCTRIEHGVQAYGIRTASGELTVCDNCRVHHAATGRYASPDPYARDLAALRVASATPMSTFEARYKAERMAALAAEPETFARLRAAHASRGGTPATPPRFTVAELRRFTPPDSYAEPLRRLREQGKR